MSEEIKFNGMTYVSAADAAENFGFSRDYVARLCRESKVIGHRVGKAWFVSELSLKEFVDSQEQAKKVRHAAVSEEVRQMYRNTKEKTHPIFGSTEGNIGSSPRVSTHIHTMHTAIQSLAIPHAEKLAYASRLASSPTSVAHAVVPVTDFLHRALVFAIAALFLTGAVFALNPEMRGTLASHLNVFGAASGNTHLAAAGETGFFSGLARAFNTAVDELLFGEDPASNNAPNVTVTTTNAQAYKPDLAPTASSTAQVAPVYTGPVTHTTVVNPVTERIVERVIERPVASSDGITEAYFSSRLNELENKLSAQMYGLTAVSSPPASGGFGNIIAMTNKIDNLNSVEISDSTISGGSITGVSISGTSGSLSSLDVTGTALFAALTATNATTTTLFAGAASSTNLYTTYASSSVLTATRICLTGDTCRTTWPSGATWGSITGTLADQTDLQSALDLKLAATALDSIGEAETLWGAINILTETEIDASSELAALLDDETGTGNVVFSASPTFSGTLVAAAATFSGNVGIGTTSPWAKLSVQNTTGANLFNFTAASGTATTTLDYSSGYLQQHGDTWGGIGAFVSAATNQYSEMYLGSSRGDRVTPSATQSGDSLGAFRLYGYGTSSWVDAAYISAVAADNFTNSSAPADLTFNTTPSGATTGTERVRISSTGNVGIGTTTPWRKLSIVDAVSTAQTAVSYDSTNTTQMLTSSVGDYFMYPSGGDALVNNGNLWVCTGGADNTNGCPTGTPSGFGNLIVETKFGVASSTPWSAISVGADGSIVTTEKALSDGATIAINWNQGNQQQVTLGGNRAITFSGYIPGQTLRLIICQDGTGSRTITSWPAAVLWAGGSAPTLTTTLNKCDVLTFLVTAAEGTIEIFGSSVLNF